jgi:PAS domain S-box-containing protein
LAKRRAFPGVVGRPSAGAPLGYRWLQLAALAVLAALINQYAPTVFFDSQLMLGSSVAVLALLLFGWSGLLVGAAALLVTVVRWGHPFELLIGMGLLIWLRWFLDRLNGGPSQYANGRIVLAAIGYWLLIGIPAEILLFLLRLGVDPVKALGLGLKEAVVSVLSVALGLVAYVLFTAWRYRGRKGQISARGITFATVLLAVSLPGVLITIILSSQLRTTALQGQLQSMQQLAREAALAGQLPEALLARGMALRWQSGPTTSTSTDPALFARLASSYQLETPSRVGLPGLELLVPSGVRTVLQADLQSYWQVRSGAFTVVQPAHPLIRRLDYELLLPSFSLMALLLLLAAVLAEAIASAVERQFLGVIRPLQGQPNAKRLPDLGGSVIRELQLLVQLVNRRTRRTQELSRSLQQARDELAQTALAITEAIPVGTYTMVLRPGEELPQFSFLSERFLEIFALEREAAQANPLNAFACVHPDDYEDWLALNAITFARKLPFKGQCRLLVGGKERWVLAESVPRDLADGSTVWEGVISDITEQMEAEQELRRMLNVLPIPVGSNRLAGEQEIVFLNQRFLDTFGYAVEDLPTLEAWAELAFPDPAYRQGVMDTWHRQVQRCRADGGEVDPMELEVVCKDGSRRSVILTATLHDDGMVGAFLDITERKRAEAALEQAFRREAELKERQRLELEAKLRTSLTAAAVAHEIKQPLSAVLLNARRLQTRLEQLPDGQVRNLLQPLLLQQVSESQRIVTTIEKMGMLLRNVQTEQQRIDLCDVVANTRLYLRPLLARHGVYLESSGLDQPRWLQGDASQLQMALANLIRNALEALSLAGVAEPRLRLSLHLHQDAHGSSWLELRLADNGPGFSDLQLEQLLLASTKPQGSGLGLFVVNAAVQIHGGSVQLGRSAELGGAEVLLRLPALAEPS